MHGIDTKIDLEWNGCKHSDSMATQMAMLSIVKSKYSTIVMFLLFIFLRFIDMDSKWISTKIPSNFRRGKPSQACAIDKILDFRVIDKMNSVTDRCFLSPTESFWVFVWKRLEPYMGGRGRARTS